MSRLLLDRLENWTYEDFVVNCVKGKLGTHSFLDEIRTVEAVNYIQTRLSRAEHRLGQ